MMARIQPTDDKSDAKPTYDAEFICEVNALQVDMINGLLSKSDHEQRHHEKLETIIYISADDQINSDNIYDDPYMDNNSGQAEHDTNAHDQSLHDFESLINNIQVEAEKQRKMNIELKKQQALIQREFETEKSGLPPKKMPDESKLLKLFVNLDKEIKQLGKLINISLQMKKERTVIYDEQNETRRYFILLKSAITQHYSTPTNNLLRTSLNTKNQVVIQDGHVDIQSKNIGYAGNGNKNAGKQNRNQATIARNGLV
nr:hypothetical protein [Tanacetum cinerariifolium]